MDVLSGPGTQTSLDFINSPTTLEFADTSFSAVDFSAVSGQIEVPDTTTTGRAEEMEEQLVRVFPNPVADQSSIVAGPSVDHLEIRNVQGQTVKQFTHVVRTLDWKGTDTDGQRLPSGVYWLIARTPHTLETVKIYLNQKP